MTIKGFRPNRAAPRLAPAQLQRIGAIVREVVDTAAAGRATQLTLDDWTDNAFTFSRLAEMQQRYVWEWVAQLRLVRTLQERFTATRSLQLSPDELEQAREGVRMAEELAKACDAGQAAQAAMWSVHMRDSINTARFRAVPAGARA